MVWRLLADDGDRQLPVASENMPYADADLRLVTGSGKGVL